MVNGRTEAEDMAARHGEPPQWPCPICGKYVDCCSCHYRASDVIVATRRLVQEIERLRAAEPRWIPVSERLPEVGVRVLVACTSMVFFATRIVLGSSFLPQHQGQEKWVDDEEMWIEPNPDYWMPLPAPPAD